MMQEYIAIHYGEEHTWHVASGVTTGLSLVISDKWFIIRDTW